MTPTTRTAVEIDARHRRSAIRFFWTWLILTTCVSLAGNTTHAWLTAPHDNRWLAVWVAAVAPALAVGAFVLSFIALRDLAVIAGIQPRLALVLPLVIDLAIGVATLALVAVGDKPAGRVPTATRSATVTPAPHRDTTKATPATAATRVRDDAAPPKAQSATSIADSSIRELAVQLVAQKATRKPVDTVTEVLAAHGQGHPLNRIAKQVGIHHSVASRIIDAAAEHRQLAAVA
ncbi:DUF2637 domain-containing protein [Mycolicibacterium aubagnense]|uniref:DUF2637 domain-containing protein n=1 Tax=Mycolicibacterium aubagnense TaxID=319707 RepID=A0ABM7IJH8_9MYCO|nr:DUF2637 domain-containing protein [Mycolicibacterium aubagnense]TLH66794.1 hypothetical protein C1S80_06920 [Mycolicibacterium aubagnense]WGI31616.1 DUF2637 domain-containing protein [Mycolicibacterium aubagnense]BBX86915.1 hypothetical protein MAUB_47880 [Mycolicibacterium aubagnense]